MTLHAHAKTGWREAATGTVRLRGRHIFARSQALFELSDLGFHLAEATLQGLHFLSICVICHRLGTGRCHADRAEHALRRSGLNVVIACGRLGLPLIEEWGLRARRIGGGNQAHPAIGRCAGQPRTVERIRVGCRLGGHRRRPQLQAWRARRFGVTGRQIRGVTGQNAKR